jgi:hypothetical protein
MGLALESWRIVGSSIPATHGAMPSRRRADRVPIVYPRAGLVWRTEDGVVLTFIGPSLPFIQSENTDPHADVLKIGHHGSAYSGSPECIATVHPKYAIISVGRHNMFGHPAASTIETLRKRRLNYRD